MPELSITHIRVALFPKFVSEATDAKGSGWFGEGKKDQTMKCNPRKRCVELFRAPLDIHLGYLLAKGDVGSIECTAGFRDPNRSNNSPITAKS